jgi:formylglycine-generating enzyme required for sulfatase activity
MPSRRFHAGIICLALTASFAFSAENSIPDERKIPAKKTVRSKPQTPQDMVLIPAGEFTMGSNKVEDDAKWRGANALNPYGFNDKLYVDEHPEHKVTLPAFLIDIFEVSNAQYLNFTLVTRHDPPGTWVDNGYNLNDKFLYSLPLPYLRQVASERFKVDADVSNMNQKEILAEIMEEQNERNKLPVTTVTWADADAYCRWAGKRLPTEAEWEKAARGPNGFEYPWGNEWDPKKINTMSENPESPYSAGGSFPGDKSVYGVYDMAANVSEWVADWYDAYPGAPQTDNQYFGKTQKVTRGGITSSGHYDALSLMFRAAKRAHLPPDSALIDLGFRCAKDVK